MKPRFGEQKPNAQKMERIEWNALGGLAVHPAGFEPATL